MNEQASTDPDRRRWVLQEIARDAEADVHRFEGQPFTGKTVGEYMGCQAAAIKALAEIVETLLPVDGEPGRAVHQAIHRAIQNHVEKAPHALPGRQWEEPLS